MRLPGHCDEGEEDGDDGMLVHIHFGLSALLFLLQHLIDFLHHVVSIPPANECVVDGAVGIDEHPNGYAACITWKLAVQRLKLLLGQAVVVADVVGNKTLPCGEV